MEECRFTEEKTVRILREADRGSVAEPAKQTDMASVVEAWVTCITCLPLARPATFATTCGRWWKWTEQLSP